MSMVVLDQDENFAILLRDEWKTKWLSERYEIDFLLMPPAD